MNLEYENKLAGEFPFMHRNSEALKQNYISDLYGAFGFECGDGWYELLQEMCVEIAKAYTNQSVEIDFKPLQIKEKYGTLRVYFATSEEMYKPIQKIIDKYKKKSETICEECGQLGMMRNDLNWIRVLCDTHYQSALNIKPEDKLKKLPEIFNQINKYIKDGYSILEAINKTKNEAE